jgi:hypothetical protein
MADVSSYIIKELWKATEYSTWDDLLKNLDEIYELDIISIDQWEDLAYAIKKCRDNKADFPETPGELSVALDPYM